MGIDPFSKEIKPVYECNSSCKCSKECPNRVVQQGIQICVELFQTEQKGLGLRTLEFVPQDTFVCEYAGEVLTFTTAKKRTQVLNTSESNFIQVLKEHLGSGDVVTTYVDSMFIGNAGRFINHSCQPNLYMVPVRVNNAIPHLALFAVRDIEQGEELSYDYSGVIQQQQQLSMNNTSNGDLAEDNESSGGGDLGDRKKSLTPVFEIDIKPDPNEGKVEFGKKTCRCGSDICRGYLPFDASLYPQEDNC